MAHSGYPGVDEARHPSSPFRLRQIGIDAGKDRCVTLLAGSWPDGGKTNDAGALAFMPFVEDAIVHRNGSLKNVRSNCDFELVGMRRRDEDMLAPKFSLRRLFSKIAWTHSVFPFRSRTTERADNGTITHVRVKPSSLLIMGKTVPFLPTVAVWRRTVVGFPTRGAAA